MLNIKVTWNNIGVHINENIQGPGKNIISLDHRLKTSSDIHSTWKTILWKLHEGCVLLSNKFESSEGEEGSFFFFLQTFQIYLGNLFLFRYREYVLHINLFHWQYRMKYSYCIYICSYITSNIYIIYIYLYLYLYHSIKSILYFSIFIYSLGRGIFPKFFNFCCRMKTGAFSALFFNYLNLGENVPLVRMSFKNVHEYGKQTVSKLLNIRLTSYADTNYWHWWERRCGHIWFLFASKCFSSFST